MDKFYDRGSGAPGYDAKSAGLRFTETNDRLQTEARAELSGATISGQEHAQMAAQRRAAKIKGGSGNIPGHPAFGQVGQLQQLAMLLSNRVYSLSNRVVGAVPESARKAEVGYSNDSLLGILAESCCEPIAALEAGLEAIERIERALP